MKPSLLKHAGCDIIDINPGPGLWSSALHDLLKPRTHILMEPDYELYKPMLQHLLDKDESKYKFVPISGAVWTNLQQILTPQMLPEQIQLKPGDPRLNEPNDSLLFIANLSWHPRKSYRAFPSLTTLVLYQLLSAVRSHSLFHRYGLVRMLIWTADEEKKVILPRTIADRKKPCIEAEISCAEINEVASSTEGVRYQREHDLDVQGALAVLKRMEEAGITTPPSRQGPLEIEVSKIRSGKGTDDKNMVDRDFWRDLESQEARFAAGEFEMYNEKERPLVQPLNTDTLSPQFLKLAELKAEIEKRKKLGKKSMTKKMAEIYERLESGFASGRYRMFISPKVKSVPLRRGPRKTLTAEGKRLIALRARSAREQIKEGQLGSLFKEYDHIVEMYAEMNELSPGEVDSLQKKIKQHTEMLTQQIDDLNYEARGSFNHLFDTRRAFKTDPPILCWDRRYAEPLKVLPSEFFPMHASCLLDIQPKALWPILRDNYPENYDVFEYIVATLFLLPTQSVRQGLKALAPGAYEWLVAECPSLTDSLKGGCPDLDLITVRCMTTEMYKEIIEAWMKWPFRPSRFTLISKGSDVFDPSEENGGL
jgi:transcription factor 1